MSRALSRARVVLAPRRVDARSSDVVSALYAHASAVDEPRGARAEDARRRESGRGRAWKTVMGAIERVAPFARSWGERARAYGERTWRGMGARAPGSAGRRIYDWGQWALERVDPREDALRALPVCVSSMEVVYPGGGVVEAREAREAARRTLAEGARAARTATRMYAVGVPLSLPMFLSPVSNFPLYYFVYRLWGSTRATARGTEALRVLESVSEREATDIEARVLRVSGGERSRAACERLRDVAHASTSDGAAETTSDGAAETTGATATTCCRLAKPGAAALLHGDDAPSVLFVPCDALGKITRDARDGNTANVHLDAAAAIERLFGATGVVDLARRHARYDEIYPSKSSA